MKIASVAMSHAKTAGKISGMAGMTDAPRAAVLAATCADAGKISGMAGMTDKDDKWAQTDENEFGNGDTTVEVDAGNVYICGEPQDGKASIHIPVRVIIQLLESTGKYDVIGRKW